MPTFGDETLHDRYAREHADHMARLAKMTPEQIAGMELSLHNALAEVDRLRAKASQGGEAVAEYQQLSRYGNWDRIDKVDFDLGILGSCPEKFRALYTHPADQVAEGSRAVPLELLERVLGCIDAMGWDDLEVDIRALMEVKP